MRIFHRFNLQVLYFAVFSTRNKTLKLNYILLRDFIQGFYVYEFDHNQCTFSLT
jgi:hypothetical protein